METYVVEMLLPSGPHWYSGIERIENKGITIKGAGWSPYWEDREELNEALAITVAETLGGKAQGIKAIPVGQAMKQDAWQLIDKTSYAIRAKYLSVDLIVRLPGHGGVTFWVKAVTDKEFVLCPFKSDNVPNGGAKTYIGRNSEKIVVVTGKYQRKEVEA